MTKLIHTPGPLNVQLIDKFPFGVTTYDEEGEVVYRECMPSHSTRQKTLDDNLTGRYMLGDQENAAALNQRCVADAFMRAQAAEMFRVLQWIIQKHDEGQYIDGRVIEEAREITQRAIWTYGDDEDEPTPAPAPATTYTPPVCQPDKCNWQPDGSGSKCLTCGETLPF